MREPPQKPVVFVPERAERTHDRPAIREPAQDRFRLSHTLSEQGASALHIVLIRAFPTAACIFQFFSPYPPAEGVVLAILGRSRDLPGIRPPSRRGLLLPWAHFRSSTTGAGSFPAMRAATSPAMRSAAACSGSSARWAY